MLEPIEVYGADHCQESPCCWAPMAACFDVKGAAALEAYIRQLRWYGEEAWIRCGMWDGGNP